MTVEQYSPENYTGSTQFAHLHSHSIYSSLDGVASISEYAEECVKRNWPGMAITEHGHMGSVPDFYFTFKEHKLKPIPACEIYYNDYEPVRRRLAIEGISVKSPAWRAENLELSQRINRNRHLTVLCKNQVGFHNLLKLTTEAYRDGLYGAGTTQYNRIWFEKLCSRKEGLIVLSGCLNGPVSFELRNKHVKDKDGNIIKEYSLSERLNAAVNYVKKFKQEFGEDYYIELQMPGIEDDHIVFQELVSIANCFKIKTVLTNDSHYLQRRDYDIQTIMMAVAQGTTVDSPDLFHVNSSEQFFKTRAELWSYFMSNKYSNVGLDVFHNSCDNTLEIIDKCEHIVLDSNPKFPRIDNDGSKLIEAATKELIKRKLHLNNRVFNIDGKDVTYKEQMSIELKRFISKGFASYFLITEDIIKYGKSRSFIFGPRGSAGGSLVCYLLGLHSLDPMIWGLSFDRFLAEARGGFRLNMNMPKPVSTNDNN